MQIPEPTKEHRWLQRLLGNWTSEMDCPAGPDQPAGTVRGTETVRSIGDLWVVCEGKADMPGGGTGTTVMTLGYDPARQKFVGTFIGSMMTHMWVYEGTLDAAGNVLTLDTEGPRFDGKDGMAKYKDVIELPDDTNRVLWSQSQGDDGQWTRFMTANYRRVR
jgi:Protein of unknown function (DUF1579)